MKASASIAPLAAIALAMTSAACSSPPGVASSTAGWNTHGWVDYALAPAPTGTAGPLISNAPKGEAY